MTNRAFVVGSPRGSRSQIAGLPELPHGIAQGRVVAASMALTNNGLLLGVPHESSCPSGCVGAAHIYDVNRLAR